MPTRIASQSHPFRATLSPVTLNKLPGMLLLLFVLAAPGVAQPPLAFPLAAKRILFLGDSITHAGGYVAWIDGQLRLQGVSPRPEIINLGLGSETCCGLSEPGHPFPRPNVHERLDRALKQLSPDVVVACYGMNDGIYHPFAEDRFRAYQDGIRRLIAKVHAAGAKIVLLTPPPFDPVPVANRLVGPDHGTFGYQATYRGYEDVLKRYAEWIMTLHNEADLVIDIHTPMLQYTKEQRKTNPKFSLSRDGVHPGAVGHRLMAETILKAWGVESVVEPTPALTNNLNRRTRILHDAWLTAVGHKHPRVRAGLPVDQAKVEVAKLDESIDRDVEQARRTTFATRQSNSGTVFSVHFAPTARPGELRLAVSYYLWIPDKTKRLRGIIVHQHGCGPGASLGGRTAADDLHWQALARKWDCALMGSSYEPRKGINCRLWCDPRQGSAKRFLAALDALAEKTGHPEVSSVPWCLWGHSGGGFWASLIQTMYPQRIVAIWFRSGTAYYAWEDGSIPRPDFPAAMFQVPMLANPGLKEKDDPRFHTAWDGLTAMRQEYQKRGAPFFEFAADPRTAHECGDSRYLAIPYFDFWLAHRLPDPQRESATLRTVDRAALADWKRDMAPKADEYRRTGGVSDSTPPPPPRNVTTSVEDGHVVVRWLADADLESGIRAFRIYRDGKQIGQVPAEPKGRFGRPLFQTMSYHDTPETPLPKMEFVDRSVQDPKPHRYSVQTVNSVGLVSQ